MVSAIGTSILHAGRRGRKPFPPDTDAGAAAVHIVQVALRVCFLASKGVEMRVDGTTKRPGPLNKLSAYPEPVFRLRYSPWVKSMMVRPVGFREFDRGRDRMFAYRHAPAIVTDVALDNVGMREVETHYRARYGHAQKSCEAP
jgi:hypothetical protein